MQTLEVQKNRVYSNLLLDMVDEGMVDAGLVVQLLVDGISEEDVKKIFLASQRMAELFGWEFKSLSVDS